MPDALTQIGTFLSSGAGKALLTAGTVGTGLTQNLLANSEAQSKQKFVESLISNPTKFASYVKSFEQPLQAGLTADVTRSADAYGAEHGLGSSPAVMSDVVTQALAPYFQQQQSQAQNSALSALGIYSGAPTTKPVDISSILKMLMMNSGTPAPNPTAGINPASVPTPGLTPTDLGLPGPATLPSPLVGGGGGFDPTTMEGS
jgi:hypothetical protein